MEPTWYSLLPPLITLALAFATRNIVASLGAGILSAALITAQGDIVEAVHLSATRFLATTELANIFDLTQFLHSDKLLIFIFLIFLGTIITLICHSGGAYAYGSHFRKKLTDGRAAETTSLLLSLCLFVDDYFSSITVGSVMRPITDTFKIPRAKLAFLVDSMGAPLCAFSPISSWGAAIVMQLSLAGISPLITGKTLIIADPFSVFLHMIFFNFHTIFIICATWFIVHRRISFGLMKKHETVAQKTGNLFNGKPPIEQKTRDVHETNIGSASLVDFVLPIITLFASVVFCMLYTGGFYLLGGTKSLFATFNESQSALSLCVGALITLIVTLALMIPRGKVTAKELPLISKEGFDLMFGAIKLLVFAWTLSSFLREDIQTGAYIAGLIPKSVSPIFLPPLFMLCGTFIAFSIGSAWGTMAILFPIALPMLTSMLGVATPIAAEEIPLLYPTLAAVLSGAVFGDHISPIADVTIMASSSAGAYHLDYISAQLGYALPVGIASLYSFIIAGCLSSYGIWIASSVGLTVGLILTFGMLEILNRLKNRA